MAEQLSRIVPVEQIQSSILTIRNERIILDSDLARLYGVTTKRLNEQVKRNIDRFPEDFVFQLNDKEVEFLRSQFATSKKSRGGRRYLPKAFTEHGVVMAAAVLNSPQAIQTSVFVVRAFVEMRRLLLPFQELRAKLNRIEKCLATHDRQIVALIDTIRLLMPSSEPKPSVPFGFRRKNRT